MEETGFAAYHRLLDEYWPESDGETRHRIEDEIWRRFGIEAAVLVLDMSGFSRLTQQYGAVHYLSMVRRMNISMEDVIARNQGQLVKFEADNSFAIFPTVNDALRCAIAANMQFQGMNLLTVERFDIRVCIGIAYGKILLVDGRDFFGEAVNTASRLGEDLADPGEILVDAALEDALAAFRFDRIERDTPRGRVDALSIRY
ncbi:MAG: adenylate/guanylate cyclase domain-containing protein [Minwuia sp.]|uniref:adenylate/guanylate cyclase domain-containing protein n=1 Tax=Minwuia sp. TaxID=2493630 RepID=UPI003A85ECE7